MGMSVSRDVLSSYGSDFYQVWWPSFKRIRARLAGLFPSKKRLRLWLLYFLAPPEEPEPFYKIVWQNGSSVLWAHMQERKSRREPGEATFSWLLPVVHFWLRLLLGLLRRSCFLDTVWHGFTLSRSRSCLRSPAKGALGKLYSCSELLIGLSQQMRICNYLESSQECLHV